MIKFTMPMRLENLANKREHHFQRSKRARCQRGAAFMYCGEQTAVRPPLPLVIRITRVGKKLMDSDGLTISAKHIRDGIADWLGVDDGSHMITWTVLQRVGKDYSVEVEIS